MSSAACAGTLLLEFGSLSRLTGDYVYEMVAKRALLALWGRRSESGLVGGHIDIATGTWTHKDSGVGTSIDSYYEYLIKCSCPPQIDALSFRCAKARRWQQQGPPCSLRTVIVCLWGCMLNCNWHVGAQGFLCGDQHPIFLSSVLDRSWKCSHSFLGCKCRLPVKGS